MKKSFEREQCEQINCNGFDAEENSRILRSTLWSVNTNIVGLVWRSKGKSDSSQSACCTSRYRSHLHNCQFKERKIFIITQSTRKPPSNILHILS